MGSDDGDTETERSARTALEERGIDVNALSDVIDQHPVRLAVLFGSRVKGTQHVDSDVDVALEFERDAAREEALLPLISDLASVTGDAGVDVGTLPDMEPEIGVALCRNGVLLVGDRDRFDHHCQRFREQLQDVERRPARDRFHEIVQTAKRAVESDA